MLSLADLTQLINEENPVDQMIFETLKLAQMRLDFPKIKST